MVVLRSRSPDRQGTGNATGNTETPVELIWQKRKERQQPPHDMCFMNFDFRRSVLERVGFVIASENNASYVRLVRGTPYGVRNIWKSKSCGGVYPASPYEKYHICNMPVRSLRTRIHT